MNAQARLLLLACGLGGAVLAGWLAHQRLALAPSDAASEPAPAVAVGGSEPAARIADLQVALDAERAARLRLETDLSQLRAQVDELVASRSTPPPPRPTRSEPATTPPRVGEAGRWLDKGLLADSGLSPGQIERLAASFEAIELERLQYENRAARSGLTNTPTYYTGLKQFDSLVADLREELGDEQYDWLLFAAHRPNRVVVQDVLGGSAASGAQIRRGDVILRYAGMRVFDQADLTSATQQGREGDMVTVELMRSGELRNVYLPRGALGVRIGTSVQRPEPSS